MKKVLRDFFTFEKRGHKGMILLLIILTLQLITLWLCNFYQPLNKSTPEFVLVNPHLLDSLDKHSQRSNEAKTAEAFNDDVVTFRSYKKQAQRFKFNPNTISDEGWLSLGLNKGQVRTIRKYIDKGGKFRRAEEVFKIKVVDETLWKELIPYIELENIKTLATPTAVLKDSNIISEIDKEKLKEERFNNFRKNLKFEFNTCSRFNLKQLNLLDSITIDKIVYYKRALGGFISLEQLYEIEQIDTTNFAQLKSHLSLDLMSVKTININNCSVSQLNKHPYISYNVATALVNYRNTHGKYSQISDLKKCMAMNDQLLKKIAPYLRLSDN